MTSKGTIYALVSVVFVGLCGLAVSHEINYPPIPPGGPLPHPNTCAEPIMGDVLHICEFLPQPDGSMIVRFNQSFTNLWILLESEYDGQEVGVHGWWDRDDVGDLGSGLVFPIIVGMPTLPEGQTLGMGFGTTTGLYDIQYYGKLLDLEDTIYWTEQGGTGYGTAHANWQIGTGDMVYETEIDTGPQ